MVPPAQVSGTYNSVVGGISETIGNAIGSKDISQSGKEQKAAGDGEYKAAQAKEYGESSGAREWRVGIATDTQFEPS